MTEFQSLMCFWHLGLLSTKKQRVAVCTCTISQILPNFSRFSQDHNIEPSTPGTRCLIFYLIVQPQLDSGHCDLSFFQICRFRRKKTKAKQNLNFYGIRNTWRRLIGGVLFVFFWWTLTMPELEQSLNLASHSSVCLQSKSWKPRFREKIEKLTSGLRTCAHSSALAVCSCRYIGVVQGYLR
jgi:hypothetical protein